MEIGTPHDAEARYSQKVTAAGQRDWIGCRDHQIETCDETGPNVIVQVVIRPAPQQDIDALDAIHQRLTRRGFRPVEHVVDGGYVIPDSGHEVEHRPARPGPRRPAGRPAAGLHQGGLPHRLGQPHPHLPERHHQPALETRPGRRPPPAVRPLPPQGMPGMRRPPEVHRQRRRQGAPPPPAVRAAAGDPDAGPERPEDRHLAAAPCRPRGLRGHRLRNRPRSRPAALPLSRPGEGAPPTRPHRRRNQHRPPQRILPTRHHTSFSAPTTQPLPAALPRTDDLKITNSIPNVSQIR